MSTSTTAKVGTTRRTSSRRSKKSQAVTSIDTATVDGAETQNQSNLNTDKGAQVIAMPQLKVQETAKQEASQVSMPPLPGNRPVDTSSFQVVGTMASMGEDRPIAASPIKVRDIIAVSGERPVAASSIQLSEAQMIMKNRPIASNYVDGDGDLMGYLD